jgi:type I restriction enzyme S subunit
VTMPVVRLSEVCEINPRMPKSLADDDIVSFLPMTAVSEDGQVEFEEQRKAGDVRKGYTYFERGDVLVAKITPCFENGKATRTQALGNPVGFGSTEFHVLRAGSEVDSSYLFHLIWNSKLREIGAQNMTGSAGQKRVPADFLKRLEIPLPPIDEQRRIGAILDKADALRRKRKRALDLLDSLTPATFRETFGNLERNTKRFPEIPLANVVRVTSGFAFSSVDFGEEGAPVVRISNLDGEHVRLDDAVRISEARVGKGKRSKVAPGDLLIAMSGATTGKTGIVPPDARGSIYLNQRVGLYQILDDNKLCHSFLVSLVRSTFYQKFLRNLAWGAAQPNVSGAQLTSLKIPLPPMDLQKKFAEIAKCISSIRKANEVSHSSLNLALSSLQHRAFSGQL